ncbi:MAG: ABC transporter ATP-binding protein [Candidatus Thermoplasmatota archaeon]|nr:ABC transporter ATP-binding protein [Candidatus Thermoplasmatota archaeon]MCL5665572.1 ABC transporter ATP-binding protein [Candidatus Thermoplasmatota archaeon]
MNELPLVYMKDIRKYFGNRRNIVTAVDGVSMSVERGKNAAIVGETGSGKTTLGRISCGLEYPNHGTVMLDGENLKSMKNRELWKTAQYIHQDPYGAVDPLETVQKILQQPLRNLLGLNDQEMIDERIRHYLSLAGLDESYVSKRGGELSGGEKQRLLIARAFIMGPKYVVVDEPTTMIDFIHRNEVVETIREIGKSNDTTITLITHDLGIVGKLSQIVHIMFRGAIIESGPVDEVMVRPYHPYTIFLASIKPSNVSEGGKITEMVKGYGRLRQSFTFSRGCRYAHLCPLADDRCRSETPAFEEYTSEHFVACFKPGEFSV